MLDINFDLAQKSAAAIGESAIALQTGSRQRESVEATVKLWKKLLVD